LPVVANATYIKRAFPHFADTCLPLAICCMPDCGLTIFLLRKFLT